MRTGTWSVVLHCVFITFVLATATIATITPARSATSSVYSHSSRAGWANQQSTGPGESAAPVLVEEHPQPLDPRIERDEEDDDRLHALNLFAMARLKQKRDDAHGALRLYERAVRYDRMAQPALREITALALELGRVEEAARYAKKALDEDDFDSLLLRQLGGYLAAQGNIDDAIPFYEKALAAESNRRESPAYVGLAFQIGKLHLFNDEFARAYERLETFEQALNEPGRFGLEDRLQRALIQDASQVYADLIPELAGTTPPRANAYRLVAEAALAAERFDEALGAFEKANKLAPDEALAVFDRARVQAKRGNPSAAERDLQTYLDSQNTKWGTRAFELLAEILEQQDRQDELVERLASLLEAQPENARLRYFLAERYMEKNQLDDAEALIADLPPDKHTLSGYRTLAEIYRRTERPGPLLKLLSHLVERLGNIDLLGTETLTRLTEDEALDSIIKAARQMHAEQPDGLSGAEGQTVARLALEADRIDAAREFFELALESDPSPDSTLYLRWGLGLLIAERYAESARVFRKALASDAVADDEPEFNYHLAAALELSDENEAALEAARLADEAAERQSDELGGAYYRIRSRLPWIHYHAKRYDEARQAYQALIDQFDSVHSHPGARNVVREARMVLSNICVLQDDIPAAEEWLEQVLDEFPDEIGALNDLGYLWADQQKHLRRSLAMVHQAVEGEPDNPAYRDSLGWTLYQLGRYEESAAELQKATEGEQPDGIILDHLGDALLKSGQVTQAIEVWKRAAAALEKQGETEKRQTTEEKIAKHASS